MAELIADTLMMAALAAIVISVLDSAVRLYRVIRNLYRED